ncbi:MAG: hypothetical protein J1F68_03045 [Clostridiales bacterium]|nr:hypothetical protein [Clostridiales bacterium]
MKRKIIFAVVITIMCLAAFAFGAGFGVAKNGDSTGTFNTTDSNRFVVFTTKAQFDKFVASQEGDLFNVPASERAKYDSKFFETQALVLFLTDGMSGSIKVSYEGYKLDGSELHVTVKELSPQIHTMDLKYNTLCAAVPQEIAGGITKVVIESYRVNI